MRARLPAKPFAQLMLLVLVFAVFGNHAMRSLRFQEACWHCLLAMLSALVRDVQIMAWKQDRAFRAKIPYCVMNHH